MKNITEYNTTTQQDIDYSNMSIEEQMRSSPLLMSMIPEPKIARETIVCSKCGEGHLAIELDKDTGEVFGSCNNCGEQFVHITDTGWTNSNYNGGKEPTNIEEFYSKWALRVSRIWDEVQTKGKSGNMRVCYMQSKGLSSNEIDRLFTPYINYLSMYSPDANISNLDIYALQDKYAGVYDVRPGPCEDSISISRIIPEKGTLTLYNGDDNMSASLPMWKEAHAKLYSGETCLLLASQDSGSDILRKIKEEYSDVSTKKVLYYNMRRGEPPMGELVDFITMVHSDNGISGVYIDALTSYILDTKDMPSYIHSEEDANKIHLANLANVCQRLMSLSKELKIDISCILHDYIPHDISMLPCDRYYTV